jgi:phosphatidylglycerophosphate synthase
MGELEKIKKLQNGGDFLNDKLYHPLSKYFVYFFIKLDIKPNAVTLLGFLFDIIAMVLILQKKSELLFIASILVVLSFVMDTCDGTLARYNALKNLPIQKKKFGAWLDETLGVTGQFLILFSIVLRIDNPTFGVIFFGFLAVLGLFMMNFTAVLSENLFGSEKEKLSKSVKDKLKTRVRKILGITIDPRVFAFSADMQRTSTAILLMINPILVLYLFSFIGNFYWIIRYIIYRKK